MEPRYFILTNRKRTVVALVHTVVFLLVAMRGLVTVVDPLRAGSPVSAWVLAAVYVVVSSILLLFAVKSRNLRERLYFACCTTSAAFGLARQLLGDGQLHAAVYVRVLMLGLALATGTLILRGYRPVQQAVE